MPTSRFENIGAIIRQGVVLFARVVPIPAPALVGAIGAAAITKILEAREDRISEALSSELTLPHLSYLEPDDAELTQFYAANSIYPALAREFEQELKAEARPAEPRPGLESLRRWYPYLYSALILKRQIPALLFHQQIEAQQYRLLAQKHEQLSHGFLEISGDSNLNASIDGYGSEVWSVINAVYEAARDELKTKTNQLAFDIIDYILEVAAA